MVLIFEGWAPPTHLGRKRTYYPPKSLHIQVYIFKRMSKILYYVYACEFVIMCVCVCAYAIIYAKMFVCVYDVREDTK